MFGEVRNCCGSSCYPWLMPKTNHPKTPPLLAKLFYLFHDLSKIHDKTEKPAKKGWYLTHPYKDDLERDCQDLIGQQAHLVFAQWNGKIWTFHDGTKCPQQNRFWVGLNKKPVI